MKDYILKISMSERFKKPDIALDKLFAGTLHYELQGRAEVDKLVAWSSLETTDGIVLAKRVIIDWGD